jgi:hypothetical protein
MFITNVKMIEPATVSIAVYLLSNTNKFKPMILKRQPFHYKKKLCKWINKNKHLMIEVGLEELSDFIFNITNYIHIPAPTIAIMLYWVLIIIFILI